jgi:hypothetical protein
LGSAGQVSFPAGGDIDRACSERIIQRVLNRRFHETFGLNLFLDHVGRNRF